MLWIMWQGWRIFGGKLLDWTRNFVRSELGFVAEPGSNALHDGRFSHSCLHPNATHSKVEVRLKQRTTTAHSNACERPPHNYWSCIIFKALLNWTELKSFVLQSLWYTLNTEFTWYLCKIISMEITWLQGRSQGGSRCFSPNQLEPRLKFWKRISFFVAILRVITQNILCIAVNYSENFLKHSFRQGAPIKSFFFNFSPKFSKKARFCHINSLSPHKCL